MKSSSSSVTQSESDHETDSFINNYSLNVLLIDVQNKRDGQVRMYIVDDNNTAAQRDFVYNAMTLCSGKRTSDAAVTPADVDGLTNSGAHAPPVGVYSNPNNPYILTFATGKHLMNFCNLVKHAYENDPNGLVRFYVKYCNSEYAPFMY